MSDLLNVERLETQFHTKEGIIHAVNSVSFKIDEGDVVQLVIAIVELVGADRKIRDFGLRQTATVSYFRRRPRVTDIFGLAHEQRINHP